MVTELISLWLPILGSAVGVFFLSFVFWAATPWHYPDVGVVPDAEAADRAVESLGLKPGFYMIPNTHDSAEMRSQAFVDRMERGPWAGITVMRRPNMGRNMVLSFLVALAVSVLVGYLAASVLPPGAGAPEVFQVAGTAALLAYGFGGMTTGIWFGKPAGWAVRDFIDAVAFAALTGGLFAWLWPAGAAAAAGGLPPV